MQSGEERLDAGSCFITEEPYAYIWSSSKKQFANPEEYVVVRLVCVIYTKLSKVGQRPSYRDTPVGQQLDFEVYLHISAEGVHRMALTSQVGFNICCSDDL